MSDEWRQPDELLGRILEGRYRVVRIVGQGGMGTVFEGVHSDIEKRVALKVLSPAMARDENHRARFLNEARAAARISSPHVVRTTDYGRDPITFVVMEFLTGEDLAHRLAKTGPLGVVEVLELLRQICAGLEAAHKKGVVHRDIKPSNIFLAKDEDEGEDEVEVVKILDFGIAKLFDTDQAAKGITRPHEAVGTAAYMAPEQVLGTQVDRRSDIYSLGVVLFRMLVGKAPFRAESHFGLMEKHVRSLPPALDIGSPEVEAVVLRCLEKDRDRRFPDVGALLREFEDAVVRDAVLTPGKNGRNRPFVPFARDAVSTEVKDDAGVPLTVEQSLPEQALIPSERSAPAQQDWTLPSAGALPSLGSGPSERPSDRPAPLTLALVLGCSMIVGGVAFAWRYSTDLPSASSVVVQASSVVPSDEAAHRVDPVHGSTTSSNDPLVLTPETPAADPEPVVPNKVVDAGSVVEIEPRPDEVSLDEMVSTTPEKPLRDRVRPTFGRKTPTARAKGKRVGEAKTHERRGAEPLDSLVAEAILVDARSAALRDQGHCFRLAAEAHAMQPSQRAAIVMTKCACRLGDAEKAATAAKLLRGEHPKLKRLCELNGVDLVVD